MERFEKVAWGWWQERQDGKKAPGAQSSSVITDTFTHQVDLNRDAAEIEKERAKLAEKIYSNHFKSLSVDVKRAELLKQIAQHERKSSTSLGKAMTWLRRRRRSKSLSFAGNWQSSGKSGGKPGRADVNELQRIGALVNDKNADRVSQELLKRIAKNTDEMAKVKQQGPRPGAVQY